MELPGAHLHSEDNDNPEGNSFIIAAVVMVRCLSRYYLP